MVSIMHANNEIGTIEPIKELAAIAHEAGAVFHTDAVQTVGKIPVNVNDWGLTFFASATVFMAPRESAVYMLKGIRIGSLLHGGMNAAWGWNCQRPGAVGFGKAAELAMQRLCSQEAPLAALAKRLIDGPLATIPNTRLTGHPEEDCPAV